MKTITKNAFIKKVNNIQNAVAELEVMNQKLEELDTIWIQKNDIFNAAITKANENGVAWYKDDECRTAFDEKVDAGDAWSAMYHDINRKSANVAKSIKSFNKAFRSYANYRNESSSELIADWKKYATDKQIEWMCSMIDFEHQMEVRERASERRQQKWEKEMAKFDEEIEKTNMELDARESSDNADAPANDTTDSANEPANEIETAPATDNLNVPTTIAYYAYTKLLAAVDRNPKNQKIHCQPINQMPDDGNQKSDLALQDAGKVSRLASQPLQLKT